MAKAKIKTITANDIWDNPKDIIETGPTLDIGLNGGVPLGSWIILSSKPKCGKSSKAIDLVARFLTKFEDSEALYLDSEHRLKRMNLNHHLLTEEARSRITILRSTEEKILASEEMLDITENWIKERERSIVVIDSVSSLVGQAELAADTTGTLRSQGPRIMANFVRKIGPVLSVKNSIMITIHHLIANTSGYGSPWYEDGGNKAQFQSDIKLKVKKSSDWQDENNKNIGKEIDWSVEWSALGAPGAIVKNYFRYDYGTDDIMESIYLAEEFGIIMKGGAGWYTCDLFQEDGKPLKLQGLQRIYTYLQENPDKLQILLNEVKQYIS